MHPVSVNAPAGVLPCRDGPSATFASVTGGAGSDGVGCEERSFRSAERCRAEGRYRKPEASRAEVVQVRREYPRADVCLLLSTHVSLNPRIVARLKRARCQPVGPVALTRVCRRELATASVVRWVAFVGVYRQSYRWIAPEALRPGARPASPGRSGRRGRTPSGGGVAVGRGGRRTDPCQLPRGAGHGGQPGAKLTRSEGVANGPQGLLPTARSGRRSAPRSPR
jgi:hypothetical protein